MLGLSLVQRSPSECGVSECDHVALIMRRSWPTTGCCVMGGGTVPIISTTELHNLSQL